jgi:hypothetical protein
MSDSQFVGFIDKKLRRRKLLAGISSLATAAVLAVLPFRPAAALVDYLNCNLCQWPGSCPSCACSWCWANCYNHEMLYCCECHDTTSNCGTDCADVNCSFVMSFGPC